MRTWCLCLVLVLVHLVSAATTKLAEFTTYSSLEKGKMQGVTLSPRGELSLALVVKTLAEPGEPLIWTMVADGRGNLYVGTGNDGKIFRLGPDGALSLFFDAQEPEVYALALGRGGSLYVAPSPGGQILLVSPEGQATPVATLACSYIWALLADEQGNLYAATGEKAGVWRIPPLGGAELLLAPAEAHIRSLVRGPDGTLLAGSSKSGYLYRIGPKGEAFTLYDSPAEELHALIVGPAGWVYAAGVRESKTRAAEAQETGPSEQEAGQGEEEIVLPTARVTPAGIEPAVEGAVYAVDREGSAYELWQGDGESVHALTLGPDGRVVVGTGGKGRLLALKKAEEAAVIATLSGAQVTALLRGADNALYAATSNPGRIFRIGPQTEPKGTYQSELIDARLVAQWGQVRWTQKGGRGQVRLFTRSGNTGEPDETWSSWSKPYQDPKGEQITSPPARFLQWKAELHREGDQVPVVSGVTIGYRQRNMPPEVTNLTVLPPGEYYQPPRDSRGEGESGDADVGPRGVRTPRQLGKSEKRSGWRTATWRFSDPNDDYLTFDLFYCRSGSKGWRPLVSGLENNYYSWDSRLMPDGQYELRVDASDAPSNAADEALTSSRVSMPFVVDNTPPEVESLRWDPDGGKVLVEVRDQWSILRRVEYALDAGAWQVLEPRDGVLDSRFEAFELTISVGRTEERELAIRAVDAVGNVGFGYLTVRGR